METLLPTQSLYVKLEELLPIAKLLEGLVPGDGDEECADLLKHADVLPKLLQLLRSLLHIPKLSLVLLLAYKHGLELALSLLIPIQ